MANPDRRYLAEAQDRERRRIERATADAVQAIGRSMRVAGLRAWSNGADVVQAVLAETETFEALLVEAMTVAHMQGRIASGKRAAAEIGARRKTASALTEAAEYLRKRLELSPEQVQTIIARYGPEAARVTRGMSSAVEAQVQAAVAEIVETGQHVQEGMGTIRQALDAAGVTNTQPFLLETITRTQIQLAYGAGRWNANEDPAIQEILWGYEYVTVGDDRVRPNHEALDGTILPKDDPLWEEVWPPNGFNCRCAVVEIFDRGERSAPPLIVEIEGVQVRPGADLGWNFHPGKAFQDTFSSAGVV